jgi:hypothetical protein
MYADPSLIRKHVYKVTLNDREAALVDAICDFTGQQKQVLLRELLLDRMRSVIAAEDACERMTSEG